MKELEDLTKLTGLPAMFDDGTRTAGGDSYFLIAKNGFFQVVDHDEIRSVLPLEVLPGALKKAWPEIRWKGPKLPYGDFRFLCGVMKAFYKKCQSELDIHIWHSRDTGFWYRVPRQLTSAAICSWDIEKGSVWLKDGKLSEGPSKGDLDAHRIGNMHSHHQMMPEWSSIDNTAMSEGEYGIQIVVGWFTKGFGAQSRVAFNGKYTDVPLEDVVDFGETPEVELPDWLFKSDDKPEKADKTKARQEKIDWKKMPKSLAGLEVE